MGWRSSLEAFVNLIKLYTLPIDWEGKGSSVQSVIRRICENGGGDKLAELYFIVTGGGNVGRCRMASEFQFGGRNDFPHSPSLQLWIWTCD